MGGIKGRKQAKRLARRVKAFLEHGPYPLGGKNPGKDAPQGTGHQMHQPGSNKK